MVRKWYSEEFKDVCITGGRLLATIPWRRACLPLAVVARKRIGGEAVLDEAPGSGSYCCWSWEPEVRLYSRTFLLDSLLFHLQLTFVCLNNSACSEQVENVLGKKKFVAVYALAGIAGNVLSCIVNPRTPVRTEGSVSVVENDDHPVPWRALAVDVPPVLCEGTFTPMVFAC